MALTPNFTVSQNSGLPSILSMSDTSTGSDVNVVARRVYLLQSDGTYLVPTGTTTSYILWAIGNSTIDINCLVQDAALNITVDWVNVSGATVVSKSGAYCFNAYTQTFLYNLTENEVPIQSPTILLSTNYYKSKMILAVMLDSADLAIRFASNIYSAQNCLDSAAYMIANQNLFFA